MCWHVSFLSSSKERGSYDRLWINYPCFLSRRGPFNFGKRPPQIKSNKPSPAEKKEARTAEKEKGREDYCFSHFATRGRPRRLRLTNRPAVSSKPSGRKENSRPQVLLFTPASRRHDGNWRVYCAIIYHHTLNMYTHGGSTMHKRQQRLWSPRAQLCKPNIFFFSFRAKCRGGGEAGLMRLLMVNDFLFRKSSRMWIREGGSD